MHAEPPLLGWLWRAALLVGLLGGPALAQGLSREEEVRLAPVRANLSTQWPKAVSKGYFPVRVDLENLSDRGWDIELRVERSDYSGIGMHSGKSLRIEAGEKRQVELLVPAFTGSERYMGWGGYYASMQRGNEQTGLGGIPTQLILDDNLRAVLVLAPEVGSSVDEEQWAEALSVTRLSQWGNPQNEPNVSLATARIDGAMPSSSEAYSSLDLVVLDLSKQVPDAEHLGELLRWVRLGGRLMLVGEGVEAKLASLPALKACFDPRLRIQGWQGPRAPQHVGLGLLVLDSTDAAAFRSESHLALARTLLNESSESRAPQRVPAPSNNVGHLIDIPGIGELPFTLFLLLLLAFAITIGPINFIFLKKLDRPHLLLVTVPAIAAVASLALLAFGAFSQGFAARASTRTLTVLDQAAGLASTVEERTAYLPLSPASGLRPAEGTAVFPKPKEERGTFVADQTGGLLLRGAFMPVRTLFDSVVLTDRVTHTLLDLERAGDSYRLRNGLTTRLERFFLYDRQGRLHALTDPLEPGGEALLSLQTASSSVPEAADLVSNELLARREMLPGSYVAELADSPFRDDCGVQTRIELRQHALYGILPADEKEW